MHTCTAGTLSLLSVRKQKVGWEEKKHPCINPNTHTKTYAVYVWRHTDYRHRNGRLQTYACMSINTDLNRQTWTYLHIWRSKENARLVQILQSEIRRHTVLLCAYLLMHMNKYFRSINGEKRLKKDAKRFYDYIKQDIIPWQNYRLPQEKSALHKIYKALFLTSKYKSEYPIFAERITNVTLQCNKDFALDLPHCDGWIAMGFDSCRGNTVLPFRQIIITELHWLKTKLSKQVPF